MATWTSMAKHAAQPKPRSKLTAVIRWRNSARVPRCGSIPSGWSTVYPVCGSRHPDLTGRRRRGKPAFWSAPTLPRPCAVPRRNQQPVDKDRTNEPIHRFTTQRVGEAVSRCPTVYVHVIREKPAGGDTSQCLRHEQISAWVRIPR